MPSLAESGRLLFKFARGALSSQLTLDRMQSIVEAINMNRITGVVGGTFSRGKDGTTIIVKPTRPGEGGTVTEIYPFLLYIRKTAVQAWVSVEFGTLNNAVPIIQDYIDGDMELWDTTVRESRPEIELPPIDPEALTWVRYVYLKLDYNTGIVRIQLETTTKSSYVKADRFGWVQIGIIRWNKTFQTLTKFNSIKGHASLFVFHDAGIGFTNIQD